MIKHKNMKTFEEHSSESDFSENDLTDFETIETKIIEYLNEANDKLDANDFNRLAESIIDYIDDIGRGKGPGFR